MAVVQHAALLVKTCWIRKFLFGSCLARFDWGSKILCHFRQKVLNYFWSVWNNCQKTSVGHKRKSFNSSCVSVNVENVQICKLWMQITPNGNFAKTPISLKNICTLTWGDFFFPKNWNENSHLQVTWRCFRVSPGTSQNARCIKITVKHWTAHRDVHPSIIQ